MASHSFVVGVALTAHLSMRCRPTIRRLLANFTIQKVKSVDATKFATEILQAAVRVTERHGITALTLEAAAEEAGATKPGLETTSTPTTPCSSRSSGT